MGCYTTKISGSFVEFVQFFLFLCFVLYVAQFIMHSFNLPDLQNFTGVIFCLSFTNEISDGFCHLFCVKAQLLTFSMGILPFFQIRTRVFNSLCQASEVISRTCCSSQPFIIEEEKMPNSSFATLKIVSAIILTLLFFHDVIPVRRASCQL